MAEESTKQNTAHKRVGKIFALVGLIAALVLLTVLLVHSLLCVFVRHYYPTFGHYRLFAIVTDSMESEIPEGSMIAARVPESEADIEVGTVITYEVTRNKSVTLITHRVTAVHRDDATGEVSYTTRGDNAAGEDGIRPSFDDVVGVYTGKRCGFWGYFFGFLQSSEGAIALILIVTVGLIAYIVVHFVGQVNMWRHVAALALKKSGDLLSETQNDELGVISDVIGIAVKEPRDKKDARRKDKKLHWFLRTGTLPKRPYSDDLEENARMTSAGRGISLPPSAPQAEAASAESAANVRYVTEDFEQMKYIYTFTARLIGLKPQQKEWYSWLKNELLKYGKVRAVTGKRDERFCLGRRTLARLTVRGKTLCLLLAVSPDAYADAKFRVRSARKGAYSLYRITSNRSVKNACGMIADLMAGAGAVPLPDYTPRDYYLPEEGVLSLMQRNLVKRDLRTATKTYRIEEVPAEVPEEKNEQ